VFIAQRVGEFVLSVKFCGASPNQLTGSLKPSCTKQRQSGGKPEPGC
jgi:hypothetical protein